jgi:hypothetical protein
MAEPWFGSAGETIRFECPKDTKPTYQAGTFYPNEKDSTLYIIKVEGSTYLLGPMKAGKFDSVDLCGSAPSPGALNYELILPPQSQMPQPVPPLTPMAIAFPWAWALKILLILFALLAAAGGAIYWFKNRNRLAAAPLKKKKTVLSPEENLRAWIQKQRNDPKRLEEDLHFQKEVFTEGWKRLRKYLEKRFEFNVPGATAREFVGELQAALIVWKQQNPTDKVPDNLVPRVETLMTQSQAAGYSFTSFNAAVVKSFVDQIRAIHKETEKVTEASREL